MPLPAACISLKRILRSRVAHRWNLHLSTILLEAGFCWSILMLSQGILHHSLVAAPLILIAWLTIGTECMLTLSPCACGRVTAEFKKEKYHDWIFGMTLCSLFATAVICILFFLGLNIWHGIMLFCIFMPGPLTMALSFALKSGQSFVYLKPYE